MTTMPRGTRPITLAVLAGAYRGKRAALDAALTHSFVPETGEVLCGRVSPESLTESPDVEALPTCPVCLRRDWRTTP